MMRISYLTVLSWMVLVGCMVSYMLRVNMAITIVVMPDPSVSSNSSKSNITISTEATSTAVSDTSNATSDTGSNTTSTTIQLSPSERYDPWKQNVIQGSFYWGYVVTEVPGGRLGEVIGPRKVIGYSVFTASLLTLLIPVVSDFIGYSGLVPLRLLQGFALGAMFPCLYPLAAKWVPPIDRGKFMSNLLALSLGAAVTYPGCGLLISWFGWRSVFYVTGGLGLVWSALWFYLVYDSPSQHPRISQKEKLKLHSAIGNTTSEKILKVPWLKLLTSGPVWAIIITHMCVFTNYSTLSIQLPAFYSHIFHINIKEIGFYSSLPHIGKYAAGVVSGYAASYLLTKQILSPIKTRYLFVLISTGLPCVLMFIQAVTGYMLGWSVFNLIVAVTLNGAVTGGHLCGGLDVAPNFSGTIFGLANTLGSIGSSLSAYFVGHMTKHSQTFSEWKGMFWMLGGLYFVSMLSYFLLGSASIQEWNMPDVGVKVVKKPDHDPTEMKLMGKNKTKDPESDDLY